MHPEMTREQCFHYLTMQRLVLLFAYSHNYPIPMKINSFLIIFKLVMIYPTHIVIAISH
jgi:hypothetical protein